MIYIYFWIQRNALKENLTINDYGAIRNKHCTGIREQKNLYVTPIYYIILKYEALSYLY